MTRQPFRLVILGNGKGGVAALQGLLPFHRQAIDIVAVYPWSLHPKGRQEYFMTEYNAPFVQLAEQHEIARLADMRCNSSDFINWLTQHRVDGILIFGWGVILKPPLLDLPIPIVNMHPSLLPDHRGFNPFISAIVEGDTVTGVTFHQIVDTGIDTGPILIQERVPILPTDTGGDLQTRCEAKAQSLLPSVVDWFLNPTAGTPQAAEGRYFGCVPDDAACIDWALPPVALCRKVRALQPWYSPYTFLNEHTPVTSQTVTTRYVKPTAFNPGHLVGFTPDVISIQSSEHDAIVDLAGYRLGEAGEWLTPEASFQKLMGLLP